MQYLVLGADGYIGSYIYQQFVMNAFDVIGTSRRHRTENRLIHYDILQNNIHYVLAGISAAQKIAIICIAESSIDRCFENYKSAYNINVTATKQLIHELSEEGYKTIYFSSDNVFDGISGHYTEKSPLCPINKYGMMKAEMEQHILEYEPNACILRIPKVVSTIREKPNIFAEWESQRETGNIRCIRGNRMSFVCIDDIYHACLLAVERMLVGLYNICGNEAYSRAELARKFCDKMGDTRTKICECDIEKFSFKDKRPLNLEMNNKKFKDATGYQFIEIDEVIKQYFNM